MATLTAAGRPVTSMLVAISYVTYDKISQLKHSPPRLPATSCDSLGRKREGGGEGGVGERWWRGRAVMEREGGRWWKGR